MSSLRPEDLHTCTVKLSIDGSHGTGFFVSSGLILTCHHVVKNAGDRQIKVRWQNQEDFAVAKVLQSFPDPVDLALLQFETVEALACVELDGAIAAFDALFAYGYPEFAPNAKVVAGIKIFLRFFMNVELNFVRWRLGRKSLQVYDLRKNDFKPTFRSFA